MILAIVVCVAVYIYLCIFRYRCRSCVIELALAPSFCISNQVLSLGDSQLEQSARHVLRSLELPSMLRIVRPYHGLP